MKKRFTLIELLVVIAIIAILASILMPALSSARERAKSSHCINNLKQSGVGIQSYVDDHKELLIYYSYVQWNMLLNRDNFNIYGSTLAKAWKSGTYVSNRASMMCPAVYPHTPQPAKFKVVKADGTTSSDMGRHSSTYGMTCQVSEIQRDKPMTEDQYKLWRANFGVLDTAGFSLRPQFVNNPSSFFLLGDSVNKNTRTAWYWIAFAGGGSNGAYAPHNDKMNILWADGHADSNGQGDLSRKLHKSPRIVYSTTFESLSF